METRVDIPQDAKNTDLPYDPAMSLLGTFSKMLIPYQRHFTSPSMFIAAVFIITRKWKQPRLPSATSWIMKTWHTDRMECYSAVKKNKVIKFSGRPMALEIIFLSEFTETWRDKCHMFSLICRC